mgnify:CR=1 FL=1
MLVTRSAHDALMKAKDEQIASLKEELSFLRNFIQPQRAARAVVIHAEADAAIEGRESPVEDPELERRAIEIINERERILSGNY